MTAPFARWSNVLGEPGKGIHKTRLAGVAVVDVVVMVIVAIIISVWLKINFLAVLSGLFALSIATHWMFGVDTAVNSAARRAVTQVKQKFAK